MNNHVEGIVVSQREHKDNGAVLSVLTKDGVIDFIARGIMKPKSKNALPCSLFCESRFFYDHQEQRTLQLLKKAEKVQFFYHIYEDLEKQLCASLLCEVAQKIEVSNTEYVYELLQSMLLHLHNDNNPYCALGLFIAKINGELGIDPTVDTCVRCLDSSEIAGISIYDGGFVCKHCIDTKRDVVVSVDILRYFRLFHKAGKDDYDVLSKIKHYTYPDIEPIISLFNEYSGVTLKGLSILTQINTFESVE